MDMTDLYAMENSDYSSAGPPEDRRVRARVDKQLSEDLGVSRTAVYMWRQKGIPAARQAEIVKRYGLDPGLLLK